MFTFNGRDSHRVLPATKIHLPFTRPIGDILPERVKTDDDEAEPALLRLPAPGLRGTWAKAYALLTRLVSQIGWDELLKTRSQVFVMEEEYRMQKAQGDIQSAGVQNGMPPSTPTVIIHEDGTVRESSDDKASTRGIVSPPSPPSIPVDDTAPIPTIRISTESTRVKETEESGVIKVDKVTDDEESDEENAVKANKGKQRATSDDEDDEVAGNGHAHQNGGLEKPTSIATEGQEASDPKSPTANQEPFSFSNKRLCERWLDNLFMVLYEVG